MGLNESSKSKGHFRAQSAMEYLMTYGWAILVIAVVLAILFSIGVFSGGSFLGTSCIPASGYLCTNPTILTSTYNDLTFTFGQNTGSTLYNVIVGVAPQGATPNGVGFPSVISQSWNSLAGTSPLTSMVSGQQATVTVNIPLTSAWLTASNTIGSQFTGYVWVNYSTVGATSPATTAVKAATMVVKVT